MVVFAACSTACGENVWIKDGFGYSTHEMMPFLATAVRTRKKQSDKISLDIHLGYTRGNKDLLAGYAEDLNSNDWMYVSRLHIVDNSTKNEIPIDDELTDFLNEDKYFYTFKLSRKTFNFSYTKELDVNLFSFEKGYITFDICLIDNTLMDSRDHLKCGVSYALLYFSKSDNCITFSKKRLF